MSTILLLDDDAQFSKLVAILLERRNHTVLQARTGARAKEVINSEEVDLVIVDYRLPDMDGIAWITWLREFGAAIPIIFLSGFSCDSRMLNLLRSVLAVPLVLKKPLDSLSFAALVDRQLNDSSERLKKSLSSPATSVDRQDWFAITDCAVQSCVAGDSEVVSDSDRSPAIAVDKEPRLTYYLPDRSLSGRAAAFQERLPVSESEDLDRQLLHELREEFMKELPAQILYLADAINGAVSSAGSSMLATAICEAHRLRGTAGTYGLKEVSEMMGVIEDCLIEVAGVDEVHERAAIWSRVERALLSASGASNETMAA